MPRRPAALPKILHVVFDCHLPGQWRRLTTHRPISVRRICLQCRRRRSQIPLLPFTYKLSVISSRSNSINIDRDTILLSTLCEGAPEFGSLDRSIHWKVLF